MPPVERAPSVDLGPAHPAPAAELPELYHGRWQIENASGALKSQLKGNSVVLRRPADLPLVLLPLPPEDPKFKVLRSDLGPPKAYIALYRKYVDWHIPIIGQWG